MNYFGIFNACFISFSNCESLKGKVYVLYIFIIGTVQDEYNIISMQREK